MSQLGRPPAWGLQLLRGPSLPGVPAAAGHSMVALWGSSVRAWTSARVSGQQAAGTLARTVLMEGWERYIEWTKFNKNWQRRLGDKGSKERGQAAGERDEDQVLFKMKDIKTYLRCWELLHRNKSGTSLISLMSNHVLLVHY